MISPSEELLLKIYFTTKMIRFFPLVEKNEIKGILPKISFFGGLSAEALEKILSRSLSSQFSDGEVIEAPGAVPSHIHVIQSGSVILRLSHATNQVEKRKFIAGDCFGEAALLSLYNETATFVAKGEVKLVSLSRMELFSLHEEEPEIFLQLVINMARDLARKLQFSDAMMLRMLGGESRQAEGDIDSSGSN